MTPYAQGRFELYSNGSEGISDLALKYFDRVYLNQEFTIMQDGTIKKVPIRGLKRVTIAFDLEDEQTVRTFDHWALYANGQIRAQDYDTLQMKVIVDPQEPGLLLWRPGTEEDTIIFTPKGIFLKSVREYHVPTTEVRELLLSLSEEE